MIGSIFSDLWDYRHYVISSIVVEKKSRFSRSKVGAAWMIINPLAQVMLYALVLSSVLSSKLSGIEGDYAFSVYITAGILAWSLFAEITNRSLTMFIENGEQMKRLALPKITLPIIVAGSALLNNFFLFLAILVVFSVLGHPMTISLLWMPVLIVMTATLASAFGVILGVLNVFMRDIGQSIAVVLQFLFWLTPIVYPVSIIPDSYRAILAYNPLFYLVSAYHDVLVFGASPALDVLAIIVIVVLSLSTLSLYLMKQAGPEILDCL